MKERGPENHCIYHNLMPHFSEWCSDGNEVGDVSWFV